MRSTAVAGAGGGNVSLDVAQAFDVGEGFGQQRTIAVFSLSLLGLMPQGETHGTGCQVGHVAAKNLGALRRIALNILKIDPSALSLPKKRRRAMLDLTFRDSLLSLA